MISTMSAKERVHAAIAGHSRDRVPVTPIFMAWAAHLIGRSYRDYYLDGRVLADSQIAAARALNTDQVSVISDPWREASGYGMTFDFPPEGVGIPDRLLLIDDGDFASLRVLDPQAAPRLKQRVDSVAMLAREVGATHSVLGWVEGPLAEYADLRGMESAMLDVIETPERFTQAAAILVESASAFARAQVQAGADIIGVGDAAVSLMGPEIYRELVLPWQQKLFAAIHEAGALVKLHICGNTNALLPDVAQSGADVIDCDWMVPLDKARQAVGEKLTLCGHFDPAAVLLRGTPQQVAQVARQDIAAGGERFILQPGCEAPPGTPLANLQAFCPCAQCLIADALRR